MFFVFIVFYSFSLDFEIVLVASVDTPQPALPRHGGSSEPAAAKRIRIPRPALFDRVIVASIDLSRPVPFFCAKLWIAPMSRSLLRPRADVVAVSAAQFRS